MLLLLFCGIYNVVSVIIYGKALDNPYIQMASFEIVLPPTTVLRPWSNSENI